MRLPNNSQRLVEIGRTGSGKTVAGLWHLSEHNIESAPWIVYDFKTDEHIAAIPGAHTIGLDEIPSGPGVYIVRPLPDELDAVKEQMWKVWHHERIGIFVDEAYMVGNDNGAFRALLTQGRSKRIPMVICTQRPVWLDRFVFSEADFYQVFHLNDEDDKKTLRRFIPANFDKRLPAFHSVYYDVGRNEVVRFSPVPDIGTIMRTFERRLYKKRRRI